MVNGIARLLIVDSWGFKTTKEIDSIILDKLDEWKRETGASPELVEFYAKLLTVHSRMAQLIDTPQPSLSSETADARLNQGFPLTTFDDLNLNLSLLKEIFSEVVSLYAEYPQLFGPLPKSLIEVESYYPHLEEMAQAWYEEAKLPVTVMADDVNEHLLEDIIQATLKPFFANYAKALRTLVNHDYWRRSYCPICGGEPDLAFLDRENGARWLVCSRCDTEWLFQRLGCPYCGNVNQRTIAYFTDDGLYRLYVCEECKQYLKAIDLRQTQEEIVLPLERLFTLPLDAQAQEQGYSRRTKS